MDFYTISSFRNAIKRLTHKAKDGYINVKEDICKGFENVDNNFLRETNDRIRQEKEFRIVKYRLGNSTLKLPQNKGYRLIYWVSTVSDNVVLLTIYPKKGAQGANNITNSELKRLLYELICENEEGVLMKVDISNNLDVLEERCCLH